MAAFCQRCNRQWPKREHAKNFSYCHRCNRHGHIGPKRLRHGLLKYKPENAMLEDEEDEEEAEDAEDAFTKRSCVNTFMET